MKNTVTKLLLPCLLLVGMHANAQWNMVRFDGSNTFQQMALPDANTAYVVGEEPTGGYHFLLKTVDNGETWDSLAITPAGEMLHVYDIQFYDLNRGVVAGYKDIRHSMLKTSDGGETWQDITPDPDVTTPLLTAYFVNDEIGFAADHNPVLYKTTDGGASWDMILTSFTIDDIHFLDANTGFVSGFNPFTSMAVIMKTTDGGNTWEEMLSASDPDLFVSNFRNIDVVDENTIITNMSFTNDIYMSVDGGETWTTFTSEDFTGVYNLDFTSALNGHVLSNDGRIWATTDGGVSWIMEYATEWGMYGPSVNLYDLALTGETGFVSGSSGLIKRFTAGVTAQPEIDSTGNLGIYPNPISTTQVLRIATASPEEVHQVGIIAMGGQLVYMNMVMSKGGIITLENIDLQPGIYTVSLASKNEVKTQKMIVVR